MNLMPRAMLLVRGGQTEGESIPLNEGMTIIGRSSVSDMVVDQPSVSRQHAAVRGDSQGFWLMDLGSRNGTFINGNPVGSDPQRLTNWDKVELGGMSMHWIFMESQDTIEVPRQVG
ncbi:MAG: FHA domain-containing protein [SAR202 cluster bacterium]|jgi:pSer/pThr/pTyr-binding forkhead associated (FHA) protein|nr:FHA domain-containing protein [SAR202 cluster bacterium]MDP6514562.1 FHA domain-containing protein [SAR202 cluster bacterium]MDP6713042.1 FHA domain-containing protein [SAR202 cluster bacterium]